MDIKLSIAKKVEECFLLAENYFKCSLSRPRVSFDIRGQDAGRAYFPVSGAFNGAVPVANKKTEIKFNEVLLDENPDIFLGNIVHHECAHLIVYELFGTRAKPHGKEWKAVMEKVFRVDSRVQHNLDVSTVSNKPYIYACACPGGGVSLSSRQHKTAKRGGTYICRVCKGELTFKYQKRQVAERSKTSTEIAGLYFFLPLDFHMDGQAMKKINNIVGRKRPLKIFSSRDLGNDQEFKSWLRSKSIIRRYCGPINREEFEEKLFQQEISHAIYFTGQDGLSEQQYWSHLRSKGLVVRKLNI